MAETAHTLPPQPCTLVIFGGSGDLSRRKLLPALYNLFLDGQLPDNYVVIGTGRTPLSDDDFRKLAREGILKYSRQPLKDPIWEKFEQRLFWVTGAINQPQSYLDLRARMLDIEAKLNLPGNRIFYLAIPPTAIVLTVEGLWKAGLAQPGSAQKTFSRIIIEKPIGRDLSSAWEINEAVARVFDESQVFRIDHYLGKETVQNLLVIRFANSIFEPIWNYKNIDHIQITVAEAEGVGSRASYYEEAGALRDMVQNHMLQLLCLIAMEPPYSLEPNVVRDARMDVLRCLRPITGKDALKYTVRAQYSSGTVNGVDVPGYRRESDVKPDSTTETFVAVKLSLDNWRWSGVPFYLRTGKALAKRASEVAVYFKEIPQILFNTDPEHPLAPNVLVLNIQPEEGLSLRIISKVPGSKARTHPVEMHFRYGEAFGVPSPEAYERLLLDVMAGDASLFMRRDMVEASWAWITPILEGWHQYGTKWLSEYEPGTMGPVEAERLIQSDGRTWHG
jgi:glucose-6-phosphate 1-dehydrogenase